MIVTFVRTAGPLFATPTPRICAEPVELEAVTVLPLMTLSVMLAGGALRSAT